MNFHPKHKVCVIGGGKWGSNHIRVLNEMGNLGAIVDCDVRTLTSYSEKYPKISKSALRDVADASDGPGDRAAVLYVGFGCVRLREKSKMRISGSHDGDFHENLVDFAQKHITSLKYAIPRFPTSPTQVTGLEARLLCST